MNPQNDSTNPEILEYQDLYSIPVIDFKLSEEILANKISFSNSNFGCFILTNHGIDKQVFDSAQGTSTKFFSLRQQEKDSVKTEQGIGYKGLQEENLARNFRSSLVQRDHKESFNISFPIDVSIFPEIMESSILSCEVYRQKMKNLAVKLVKLFCFALEIDEKQYQLLTNSPREILRFLYYPKLQNNLSETWAGAHTDFGIMTILWSNEINGLQVLREDEEWVDVTLPANGLLIILGDLLSYLTKGAWKAAPHRVICDLSRMQKTDRYSFAYFFSPNPDLILTPFKTNNKTSFIKSYPPILVKEFIGSRVSNSFKKDS